MNINEVYTPAVLVDLDAVEQNLRRYADEAKKHGKQIWPMLKTHKSTEFAMAQMHAGATGFLCGTLDEAEAMCRAGVKNLMYAYPVATQDSIRRVIALSQACSFIVRIDGLDSAAAIDAQAAEAGVSVCYTIIVDSGLHRLGVKPEQMAAFGQAMQQFQHLTFKGISTHPGHVYGAACKADLEKYVADERRAMKAAADALRSVGMECELVTSGSTPTFWGAIDDETIQIYHPGNYIFNDVIQMCTETADEETCSLSILASVIAHPSEDLFIIDAGAKCLGLDQGAHGNSSIKGFGVVKGHPELLVSALSEEVGKIQVQGETSLKVGDKIQIIPNHSCSSANMTSYYIGTRGGLVDHLVSVDMRSNSTGKNVSCGK